MAKKQGGVILYPPQTPPVVGESLFGYMQEGGEPVRTSNVVAVEKWGSDFTIATANTVYIARPHSALAEVGTAQ